MAKRQPTASAGKKLGRYVIERELGRGGMGIVYLALDENLGRRVALKTTSVAGSGAASRNQRRARFVREVRALAQVNHPNVVHVFDAGESDDPDLGWLLHYSMEYVEGITLAQLVHRKGALVPDAAAAVCMQVAAGLGAAHKQGIIHRDVKPANIFLTTDARALIGDFGICKIEGSTQITRRDQLVGTPNYLAPEQILGDDISPATDVFALGALFYVVATNSPMRNRVDAAGLLAAAQTNESRDKALALNHFPDGLRKVLAKALERDPKARYPSCREFADALSEFASKIPPLDDAAPKNEPTMDNMMLSAASGAFAPLNDGEDAAIAAQSVPAAIEGVGGVEEMAKALLDQVGDTGAPPPKKKAALPVGKSESTVMFNLRQMEDEEKAKDEAEAEEAGSGELPVARTESTMMFNIRQMEDEEGKGLTDAQREAEAAPAPARTTPPPSVGAGAVTSSLSEPSPDAAPSEPTAPAPPPRDPAAGLYSESPRTANTPAAPDPSQAAAEANPPAFAPPEGPPPNGPPVAAASDSAPVVKSVITAQDAAPRPKGPPMAKRLFLAAISAMGGGVMGLVTLLVLGAVLSSSDDGTIKLIPVGAEKAAAPVELNFDIPPECEAATKSKRDREGSVRATKQANEALKKNRYAEAEKLAKSAVSLNPGNQAAHHAVVKIFFRKGDRDVEAIKPHLICAYMLDKRSELGVDAKKRLQQLNR